MSSSMPPEGVCLLEGSIAAVSVGHLNHGPIWFHLTINVIFQTFCKMEVNHTLKPWQGLISNFLSLGKLPG